MILDISKVEYKNFNERDVEAPALISMIEKYGPGSVLDVGAHYSWYTYAPKVRGLVQPGKYEALDLAADPQTAEIVDKYHVTDVNNFSGKFDFVFSVSVIEHVGIKPIRSANVEEMRLAFARAILDMSKSVSFLTFPFGADGCYPGEYMNVTDGELAALESLGVERGFTSECQFFYSKFPQGREVWNEVSRGVASAVPLRQDLGCTCVCLLLFTR